MKAHCYCPDLSAEEFEELDLKEYDLSGRAFYFSRTPMISHFPMNPELKIEKTLKELESKGYEAVRPLFAIFEDGLFSGKVLIEIVKPPTRGEGVQIFSNFKLVGKTFTGRKHLVPKALKEFDRYLMSQRILTTEFFFWYHSCKECEKEKGNRTIIMGRVK